LKEIRGSELKYLIIPVLTLAGIGVVPAQAQTADDVVQVLTGDAGDLGAVVAEYCTEADEADRETQIAVGAGFAQAYLYFDGMGNRKDARTISQIVCTCERSVGQILSSYLASLGGVEDQTCSTPWRADTSDSTPSLFKFTPTGGAVTEN
jgi:hypothetical protein